MSLRPSRIACALCLSVTLCAQSVAQSTPAQSTPTQSTPPPKSEADLDNMATAANELYRGGHTLDSLPLYEELHARRPADPVYTERLGMAYIAKGGASSSPEQGMAARNHARELFKLAQTQGDNSDLLQVMLEKLGPPETAASSVVSLSADDPRVPGGTFAQAEQLFNKGDLAGAVPLYRQTWEKYPKFYSAPLFAGDAEYKLGHFDEAGVWFARAIAIEPDVETAHRYWADCLMKAGKPEEAKQQYLDAFIANPYSRAPRLALRAWADARKFRYVPPPIALPGRPATGKDGHIDITIASGAKKDDPMVSASLFYQMNAAAWQGDKFKKQYPNEKTYRHSLAEEVDGLNAILEVVQNQKLSNAQLDPSTRSLIALKKDNMLECWILLDNPDQGIAQDYDAYRAAHRDLLRAYIEKYDLHPA